MLVARYVNKCDVFVMLNLFYSLQGMLYSPGIINQILQLLIILWSMSVALKYILNLYTGPGMLKVISSLIYMYTLYGTIHLLFGNPFLSHINELPSRYIYLQVSLKSLLPIYVFYHYAKQGLLTASKIRIYAIIMLVVLIPKYYYDNAKTLLLNNRDEQQSNMGYVFLGIIPSLFFFHKRPLMQYILFAIILIYLILAMKRGAIAIGIICSFALIVSNLFSKNRKQRFWSILFSIVIVVGFISVITYMMTESDYFALRLEKTLSGDSSGRDDIYESIWRTIIEEPNVFYLLCGRGADSTWAFAGNYAHNDWLETLCNNGIIGGAVLLNFYFTLFKKSFKSRFSLSRNYFIGFVVLFIIAFSKSLFSMFIQNIDISISMLLGYYLFWINRSYNELQQEELI